MKKDYNKIIAAMACVAIAAILFMVGRWYYVHDPAVSVAPRCIFKMLTGYDCPGCGSQRALHALLHGHLADAWHYNAFIFFAIPLGTFYMVVETFRHRLPRLHATAIHPYLLIPLLLTIILWWILRNLF